MYTTKWDRMFTEKGTATADLIRNSHLYSGVLFQLYERRFCSLIWLIVTLSYLLTGPSFLASFFFLVLISGALLLFFLVYGRLVHPTPSFWPGDWLLFVSAFVSLLLFFWRRFCFSFYVGIILTRRLIAFRVGICTTPSFLLGAVFVSVFVSAIR